MIRSSHFLIFLALAFPNSSVAQFQRGRPSGDAQEQAVYFSYESPCNVLMTLKPPCCIEVVFNGKQMNGRLDTSAIYPEVLQFVQSDSVIFQFIINEADNSMMIPNDSYQHTCEGGKGIWLNPLYDTSAFYSMRIMFRRGSYRLKKYELLHQKTVLLTELQDYQAAALMLELLVAQYPENDADLLALADTYWILDRKQDAARAYQSYLDLMERTKPRIAVPPRVLERL